MRERRIAVEGLSGEEPVRVLFIVGCGRSGSTILDTVLGNHAAIESVGEACHLAEKAWLSEDTYCACGKLGRECDFWAEVRRCWNRRVGEVDIADYVAMIRQIEPRLLWLPKLTRQLDHRDPRHLEYARLTANLLAAIRDASGCDLVVDSSKRASRALALSMVEGVELYLVHMVRDCRGVAWSSKKQFQKDEKAGISKDDQGKKVARSAIIWNVANVVSAWLRRYLPADRSIRLRYEDFASRPEVELGRIGELVGIDLGPLAAAVTSGKPMGLGHTIAGNRIRMSGSVRLKPDIEWTEKLTLREQAACWAASGWLMAPYGYRWRAAASPAAAHCRAA